MKQEFMSIHPNLGLGNCQSGSKFSQYCLPSSTFYAAKHCMNSSSRTMEISHSVSSSPQDSECSSLIIASSYPCYGNSAELRSKDASRSVLQSSMGSYSETNKHFSNPGKSVPVGKLFMGMHIKSAASASTSGEKHPYSTFEGFQDHSVERKTAFQYSRGITPNYLLNPHLLLSRVANSGASRVRWTQDLHELFVKCVNLLGGAKMATPKGILDLMKYDGLTISQIKSHLQKYRLCKCIPRSIQEGEICTSSTVKLDTKIKIELAEALTAQIEVQKHLLNQLEEQKNLLLNFEEQGKQLEEMLDHLKSN